MSEGSEGMKKGIKYNQDQSRIMLLLELNFRHNAVVLRVTLKSIMCSSRKYPYPPHGRDFSYNPPSPLDFPKSAHKKDPPPSPVEIPFLSHTSWKFYHSLWKPKYKLFYSTKYPTLIFTFFPEKIWWILWPTHNQKVRR